MVADCDEFQAYPDGLRQALEYCDANRFEFVEGCLVDRLASDGRLSTVSSLSDLWTQFPLGGFISARVNGAVVNKIVAMKGHVRLGQGQHQAASGRGCPVSRLYVPVHHFKWQAGLIERLTTRTAIPEFMNGLYHRECRRFIEHFQKEGCIDLGNPDLLIGPCNPDYPYWGKICEWRNSVGYFLPTPR